MKHPWPFLKWWDSGERQVVEEKLDDLKYRSLTFCPKKANLYKALSATPFGSVQVAIIGQDPYPSLEHATGVAFEVPDTVEASNFPPSLRILFKEYRADLGYPIPSRGNLRRWTSQGVLLWNTIPSVREGLSLSHDWDEWSYLTRELIRHCSERGIVFAFLGAVARRNVELVSTDRNRVILTSHPSPRGIRHSQSPLLGSRLFSTINARLNEINRRPIEWRLDNESGTSEGKVQGSNLDTGRVLPNLSGIPTPKLARLRPKFATSTFEV